MSDALFSNDFEDLFLLIIVLVLWRWSRGSKAAENFGPWESLVATWPWLEPDSPLAPPLVT